MKLPLPDTISKLSEASLSLIPNTSFPFSPPCINPPKSDPFNNAGKPFVAFASKYPIVTCELSLDELPNFACSKTLLPPVLVIAPLEIVPTDVKLLE